MSEIRRYTDVLSVLDMLRNSRITLLRPARWTDQNDIQALDLYAKARGYGAVLAFCMTEAEETYHHWQVFAGHGFGACVVFDRKPFITAMKENPSLLCGPVQYRKWADIEKMAPLESSTIPFLKREVFEAEREYRLIAGQPELISSESLPIGIDLNWIKRVIFSAATPRPLLDTVSEIIKTFDGCEMLTLRHSRLTDNRKWREVLQESVPPLA